MNKDRRYYLRHREAILERQKTPERRIKQREAGLRYYYRNQEKFAKYRREHKEDQCRWSRDYYHRNPEKCNARRLARIAIVRKEMYEAKDVPCADCKRKFPPCAMDFDHVRGKKLFNIGDTGAGWSKSKKERMEEIAKCDVVCAVCHRIREWKKRNALHRL